MPIVQIIENYYIVECAGGTGHCACFAACSKTLAHLITLWNVLGYRPLCLFCGLLRNFGLPYYIVECAEYRPLCLFCSLFKKLWLTLLTTVPIHHRHGHSGLCTQHVPYYELHRSEDEVHKLLQGQVSSSRGATTHTPLTGSGRKLERERGKKKNVRKQGKEKKGKKKRKKREEKSLAGFQMQS